MNKNAAYATDQIACYFAKNRVSWAQFYESERVIISRLGIDDKDSILDIGCGCGGLGLALREQFGVQKYTGVEINPQAAEAARAMNADARVLCGDILDLRNSELHVQVFDVVFSLSCVDWNVQFVEMLDAAWDFVRPGGYLVATFRLTDKEGCNDRRRSYQYINFAGIREGEIASYVVLNAGYLLQTLDRFFPAAIDAFGYWGAPSATAVTPYERLCFCAFAIRKRDGDGGDPRLTLDLPPEIREVIRQSEQ
jgi:SAM-dependent methyltransferase